MTRSLLIVKHLFQELGLKGQLQEAVVHKAVPEEVLVVVVVVLVIHLQRGLNQKQDQLTKLTDS